MRRETCSRYGPATRVPEDLYPLPPSADVAAGRYELLDEIAEGGMGAVLARFDRTLGRKWPSRSCRTDTRRLGDRPPVH